MATITSANAILVLAIPSLFPSPQQLQGFAADDIYGVDPLQSAETLMGVDGRLSAGFVYVPIHQHISLQADSASNIVFDTWWMTQQQQGDLIQATGYTTLPGIARKYTMNVGFLTTFPPIAEGRRTLQPRRYAITWQSIVPSNA